MISGILERDSDARDMAKLFKPEWLKNIELHPILSAIYQYINEEKVSPSLQSLTQYLLEKDSKKFEARWKSTLDQLKNYKDTKTQIYNIKKAKEIAAAYSLNYLISEQRFQKMLEDGNANALKAEVSRWLTKHTEDPENQVLSLQESFDHLLENFPWQGRDSKISTGILPIDKWAGGLRAPQLGIIIAPSGHGKSAILMNIARWAASVEAKTVLFVSNELTIEEQTERFLVRIQDPKRDSSGKINFVTLNELQDDPTLGWRKLEGYQKELDKRLYLYSAPLGQNVIELEEIMKRIRHERGAWPNLVIIDYLERMATTKKMDRGKTWIYLGELARELIWLAKRRKCAIWTAGQTNREGMNPKIELGMQHSQNSIQHIQESSLVLGVRKVQVTNSSGVQISCLEFKELKSRHGEMSGRRMLLEVDLSKMYISDREVEDIQNIEEEKNIPSDGTKKSIKSQKQVRN